MCVLTTLVFAGICSAQINAQEYWSGRYSGSTYDVGGYSNQYETIKLIPYGPGAEYGSPTSHFATRPSIVRGGYGYNESFRNPYQDGAGEGDSGCSCCPGGEVNPDARNGLDERVTEGVYRNRQSPYEIGERFGNNCCSNEDYRAPAPRRMESYSSDPTDQPPRFESPQTFRDSPYNSGNTHSSFDRFQPAPELSRQWAPEPNSNEAVKGQQLQPRREVFPPAQQNLPQMHLPSGSTNSLTDHGDHSVVRIDEKRLAEG